MSPLKKSIDDAGGVPVVALAGASVSRSLAEGLQKHWLI